MADLGRAQPGFPTFLGCVRPHVAARARGNPAPYDAVVTIRFVNCARALSTHLPFLGASVIQSFRLGPSLPKRRPHFCRNRRACQSALPHRSAADALDAGEQLRLAGEAAAAVVAHLGEDVANRQGAPRAPH